MLTGHGRSSRPRAGGRFTILDRVERRVLTALATSATRPAPRVGRPSPEARAGPALTPTNGDCPASTTPPERLAMRTLQRLLVCFGALLGSAACGDDDGGGTAPMADAAADAPPARPTVYYVVRHTERDPGADPPINAEGEVRAVALADRLETAGVDEIITTQFIRGQQSGQPLADRLGQTITVAPFEWRSWGSFAEEISAWQVDREVAGQTYLMIGHSGGYNSTLLRGLGASFDGVEGERYEDLVILTKQPDGTVTLESELYGGPSSLDP